MLEGRRRFGCAIAVEVEGAGWRAVERVEHDGQLFHRKRQEDKRLFPHVAHAMSPRLAEPRERGRLDIELLAAFAIQHDLHATAREIDAEYATPKLRRLPSSDCSSYDAHVFVVEYDRI